MSKDPFHQHGGQEAEMLEVKSARERDILNGVLAPNENG